MRHGLVAPALLVIGGAWGASGAAGAGAGVSIRTVAVTPSFFNPSLGQEVSITVRASEPGSMTLEVLDRDNYLIRKLPPQSVTAGDARISWNGRDEGGAIVPDEAYNVRLSFESKGGRAVFEPSRGYSPVVSEPTRTYSMTSGVLKYELSGPSRVHVQAGEATLVDQKWEGAVLKTIVDRAPRVGGSVVETWDGYDESGTVHVPSLKNFVLSLLSETLPPSCIIAVGNRAETFRRYAAEHRKRAGPLYAPSSHKGAPGSHHRGLSALQDFSPRLSLKLDGRRDSEGRIEVGSKPVSLSIQMADADATLFLRNGSELVVFVDTKRVEQRLNAKNPTLITLPEDALPVGEHRVTANWDSGHGPMAAQVQRVVRANVRKEAAK